MNNPDPESTLELLQQSQAGDAAARERLMGRYLPLLTRWAHGRLPHHARDLSETADLVQITLLRAFQNLPTFVSQGPGAFYGFLRQVMSNLVRDELRRVGRRPEQVDIDHELVDNEATPLGRTVTLQSLKRYEHALAALAEDQRELVVMRVELGLSNEEIARLIDSPSANAARMRVDRALANLAQFMAEQGGVD